MVIFNRNRTFRDVAHAQRVFRVYWMWTMVLGLASLLVGAFALSGSIPALIGVPAFVVVFAAAYMVGGVQHAAWLVVKPADVVREEGFIPLNPDGSPR